MGKLRIVSYRDEPFRDRRQAGQALGAELTECRDRNAVVVGIPRGGLVVARELAGSINADLDIVLSRKLRAPGHEELAMGAVSEDGKVFLNDEVVSELGVPASYIEKEKALQMSEIARRTSLIRRVLPKVPLKDRIVIVTDDGVATGATMHAAIWAARQEKPARLIVALPVGPLDTLQRLAQDADETVCLRAPPMFAAVGQFYGRFDQVSDDEVLALLREEREKAGRT